MTISVRFMGNAWRHDVPNVRPVVRDDEMHIRSRAGFLGQMFDRISWRLSAARAHSQSGIAEIELASEIEYAMRRAGCDHMAIPTELAGGPRSVQGHGAPIRRRVEGGDVVHVEAGGVERRHNAVGIQMFTVPGAPPTQ
jgi:hypothetical protein